MEAVSFEKATEGMVEEESRMLDGSEFHTVEATLKSRAAKEAYFLPPERNSTAVAMCTLHSVQTSAQCVSYAKCPLCNACNEFIEIATSAFGRHYRCINARLVLSRAEAWKWSSV